MNRTGIFALARVLTAVMVAAAAWPCPGAAQPDPTLFERSGRGFVALPSGGEVALPLAEISSVAAVGTGFIVAGVTGDGELTLLGSGGLESGGAALEVLPPPPGGAGLLRREPLLLIDGGALAGLAWLEGGHATGLAVRSARWTGDGWGPARVVAPPGPGSQLALAGTVLADGSWLLLWSAFDGEDDEILWSRSLGTGWSEPRRVAADNRVPDVTPAVVAAGGGALAAWSRYDGESGQYRVVTARLAGHPEDGWSEPAAVGPPGSLFPRLSPLSVPSGAARATGSTGGGRLLFRTARPRGWRVIDLGSGGRPRRSAAVAAANPAPPRVEDTSSGLRFTWPGAGDVSEPGDAAVSYLEASWENLP